MIGINNEGATSNDDSNELVGGLALLRRDKEAKLLTVDGINVSCKKPEGFVREHDKNEVGHFDHKSKPAGIGYDYEVAVTVTIRVSSICRR